MNPFILIFAGVFLALILSPPPASAAHYLGHGTTPTKEQIDKFCKEYPKLIRSTGLTKDDLARYEAAFKKYCGAAPPPPPKAPAPPREDKKPQQPDEPESRIDRIIAPNCLTDGAEIRVRGRELAQGKLRCDLQANGGRRTLKPFDRSPREYRYRLDRLAPGPDYVLRCEVEGDKDTVRLKACVQPGEIVPPTPEGEAPSAVDLVPEIQPGELRPGQRQMVQVSTLNRGRGQPQSKRYRVVLALVDRDVSRTRNFAAAVAPSSSRVLLQKRQWVLRIPGGGQGERVSMAMNIPAKVPDGAHWCAFADSDGNIAESNENNNLTCVPAAGALQIVKRDDLVFGSAVRRLQEDVRDEPAADERLAEVLRWLPANIQPAVERMNTLFINDSFAPGTIAPTDTALVQWNLGEIYEPAERPDGLWLLISDGPLDAADCETDLAGRFGGHVDAGLRPLFSAGRTLGLGSADYTAGNTYRVMGCLWKDGAYNGDWTNVVAFDYASATPTWLAEVIDQTGVDLDADPDAVGEALGGRRAELPIDLVAAAIWPDSSRDRQVLVFWREKNRLPLNAGEFRYFIDFSHPDIATGPGVLTTGGAVEVTQNTRASAFAADIPDAFSDKDYVLVQARINADLERYDYPDETSLDNNRVRQGVRIRRPDGSIPPPRPDLTVEILSARKQNEQINFGVPVVRFVVRNRGHGRAPESIVQLSATIDGIGNDNGVCRWQSNIRVTIPPLAPHQSFQAQAVLGTCHSSGRLGGLVDNVVLAVADGPGDVVESDEGNNHDTLVVPRARSGVPDPQPAIITVGGMTRFEVLKDGDRGGRGELRRLWVNLEDPVYFGRTPRQAGWTVDYTGLRVEGRVGALRAGGPPPYLSIGPGDVVTVGDSDDHTLSLDTRSTVARTGNDLVLKIVSRESDCADFRVGLCGRHDTAEVRMSLRLVPDSTILAPGGCSESVNQMRIADVRDGVYPADRGPTLQPLNGWICVEPAP